MKVLAVAALTLAIAGPAAAQSPTWSKPTAPFQLMGDTYYVGSEGLSAWLIATPGGHILLDTGMPQYAPQLERNIEALGFHLSDIKFLLISHAHYDHVGGTAKLKADTGATVVAMAGDQYALEKGVYAGSEEDHSMDFPPVKVDRIIKDGEKITLGGVTLTAHLTPGHTAGCTTWTWPVKDGEATRTALNFCSASVAANRLVPEQYPGIVADYRKTFARYRSIPGEVFLAPHAEQFDLWAKKARVAAGRPSPYIDRAGYETFVAAQEADFKRRLAQQEAK